MCFNTRESTCNKVLSFFLLSGGDIDEFIFV
uniref:Uncharacterized protein n=1 Tax=Siphoviridae sp. ctcj91 TaxID=2826395 RepID=A0A8S5QXX4_9CAUD|nr:MAG TPA: hypothetical protein [Siphoviridae sp. ctcj91]DAS18596.1 MAG TPA: hypothetical protein [Caudoviricetes sp.]DAW53490.1 MAG TPA: hypothetical protein [Caudoviricetes sp.]